MRRKDSYKRRIPALDGVRGCAITLILIWYYGHNQLPTEPGTLTAYIRQAIGFTWSGVDLFFVLSGFLIAGLLLETRTAPHYFKTFYISRICRIFPLYYLHFSLFVLFIIFGVNNAASIRWLFSNDIIPLWSYATFTQNIFMATHNSFGPHWFGITWPLAVEEWFALIYASLILLSFINEESVLARALRNPLLTWLGAISYGVYLFHQAVSGLVHGLIRNAPPGLVEWSDAGVTALSLLITLCLATLSYRLFERKIVAYGHSFRYS
jgi:peptidoglycan/LPS O-acetylase OafA/YrhL